MKVVYILNSSNKYNGSSKSFLFMLEGLIKQGVDPFVITTAKGGMDEIFDKRGIKYLIAKYYMDVYPPFRNGRDCVLFLPRLIGKIFYNYKAKLFLIKKIKEIEPNIIHSNVGPLHIGYKIAKLLNIPHVWHIREYQDLDSKMHPLYSMKGFKQKLAIPNNYCVAITKDIYNHFKLAEKDIVIYNGVLAKEDIRFITDKEKYFFFAGRLDENKGIKDLLETFVEFAKQNKEYRLLIAGDTNNLGYKNNLYKIVTDANLRDRVIFLGMRDDIYDLMASATALIVPSICEGFGRITAEAMFNGCLVVGNNTGGTKEILEPENLGLLYNGQEELLDVMKSIAAKGINFYYPMIQKAQKRAVELYSIGQNQSRVFELYGKIMDNLKKTNL